MSLGKATFLSLSPKQKLNTKRFTEGELVGEQNGLSVVLRIKYFIEAQGYTVEQNKSYQYSTSTTIMEKNRRVSSSKSKKHTK